MVYPTHFGFWYILTWITGNFAWALAEIVAVCPVLAVDQRAEKGRLANHDDLHLPTTSSPSCNIHADPHRKPDFLSLIIAEYGLEPVSDTLRPPSHYLSTRTFPQKKSDSPDSHTLHGILQRLVCLPSLAKNHHSWTGIETLLYLV